MISRQTATLVLGVLCLWLHFAAGKNAPLILVPGANNQAADHCALWSLAVSLAQLFLAPRPASSLPKMKCMRHD